MDYSILFLVVEAVLRVILGWRMLVSGLSNVRRWPNPVNTASILFPIGAPKNAPTELPRTMQELADA